MNSNSDQPVEPPPLPASSSPATHDGDDLTLVPLDPPLESARNRWQPQASAAAISAPLADDASNQPDVPRWQYGTRELMIVTFVFALGLATLRFVAATMFAFLFGVATFGAFTAISMRAPDNPRYQTLAWGMLVTYIVVSVAALVRG